MLTITPDKIAQVILLARELESLGGAGNRVAAQELRAFIAGLNDDEQVDLVSTMWVGRDSFGPEDLAEAQATARAERTTPTEDYLLGEPQLADYLNSGMEALGLDPDSAEGEIMGRV